MSSKILKTKKSLSKKNISSSKISSSQIISVRGKKIRLLRVKHAQTFRQRFLGLMGVEPGEHDYALVFHMENEDRVGASIHMMFMKMPLDVLFLNAQKKIVDFTTLKPWAINFTPAHAAKYVVELPAHSLGAKRVIGKIVEW